MTLLDRLFPLRDDAWLPFEPSDTAELDAAERSLGRSLPADLRTLLAAGGGSIYGAEAAVHLWHARDLVRFAGRAFPGMLLFADDEGDFDYFADPDDRLRRGAGAIFLVERSVSRPGWSRYAARDLAHLVERVLAGDDLTDAPFLDRS